MVSNEIIPSRDLFSVNFKNGYAYITIGEHSNQFQCCKEDEAMLLHMVDVIVKGNGLYGTDIVDVESIFERCTNHLFLSYPQRKLDSLKSPGTKSDSKAAILFIIGCMEMGLSDVNRIIEGIASNYPSESDIIFSAENSEIIPDGYYTLCVLE